MDPKETSRLSAVLQLDPDLILDSSTVVSNETSDLIATVTRRLHETPSVTRIRFHHDRAVQMRCEIFRRADESMPVEGSVYEVHHSQWGAELYRVADRQWRDHWSFRHFLIWLPNFGCLEVACDSVSIDPQ